MSKSSRGVAPAIKWVRWTSFMGAEHTNTLVGCGMKSRRVRIRTRSLLAHARVQLAVEDAAVLVIVLAQDALELEPIFLEHARRGGVPVEHVGSQAQKAHVAKPDLDQPPHHRGHDPAPPVGLGQPVADFGLVAPSQLEIVKAHAADELAPG